jgi:hypothetical protein
MVWFNVYEMECQNKAPYYSNPFSLHELITTEEGSILWAQQKPPDTSHKQKCSDKRWGEFKGSY